MFQVASHPTSFTQPRHHREPSHQQPHPQQALQLPRQLDRPAYVEIPREVIAAVAPELANVPAEYIRRGLGPKANEYVSPSLCYSSKLIPSSCRMKAGIQMLAPSHLPKCLPRNRLPESLNVPVLGAGGTLPTHILAVSSSKTPGDQALIFAVHGVVVASHCATMRLPPSFPPSPSGVLKLPVLHISPPSAHAFVVIYDWMYNHRVDAVLRALCPVPEAFLGKLRKEGHSAVVQTSESRSVVWQLASFVCEQEDGDVGRIMRHVGHVKDLWQDVIALGIHVPELWDTMDLTWKVLLGALNLATGKAQ